MIAASLIQTEASVDEDRPLIAAVIDNRLHDGIQLQIDSTLCYAKGGCPQPLTNADKQIDVAVQHLLVKGLPPTPIATVSTKSLKAALHPANVPYRFYVIADRSGKHAFAVTYEEHLKNVAARARRDCCDALDHRGDACRGHHRRSRRALALADDPQRRVRRLESRLGLRRVPGAGRRRCGSRARRCARSASAASASPCRTRSMPPPRATS